MEIKSIVRGRFWETWATISGSEKEGGPTTLRIGSRKYKRGRYWEHEEREKRGTTPENP